MKYYVTLVLVICACAAGLLTLFGDDSFSRLRALSRSVGLQQQKNAELEAHVSGLKRRARGLVEDDRELEKAARNELGLARPDEYIFIFDKKE